MGGAKEVGPACQEDLKSPVVERSQRTGSVSSELCCAPGRPHRWGGRWRCTEGSFSPFWVLVMGKLSAAEGVTPLRASSDGEGCGAEIGSRYFPYCCASVDYEHRCPVDGPSHCAMSPETGCQNRNVGCGCVPRTERLFFG